MNVHSAPRVGQVITEGMGAYLVKRSLGDGKYLVRSMSGAEVTIDWNDSGYKDPANAWRVR